MSNIFEDYINCRQIQKTLTFSLIPQGKTEDYIDKYGFISEDEIRAEKYQLVKPLLDKYHKIFIENCLSEYYTDWTEIYTCLIAYQRNKCDETKKALEKAQSKYRKQISTYLKKDKGYKELNPKNIINNIIKNNEYPDMLSKEDIDDIAYFNKFSTYFEGYREARNNIYIDDKATSVTYRIINDNFPKFIANCKLFEKLSSDLIKEFNEQLENLLCGYSLEEIFDYSWFSNVLSQKGIDLYNTLLGGINEKDNVKIVGLNELCNLAFQKGKTGDKKIKFVPLFKQILSDREKASFIPEEFETDRELLNSLKKFSEMINGIIDEKNLN